MISPRQFFWFISLLLKHQLLLKNLFCLIVNKSSFFFGKLSLNRTAENTFADFFVSTDNKSDKITPGGQTFGIRERIK